MTSAVYLAASFVFSALGLFVGTWTAVMAPSRVATRLGRRGKRRMEAIAKSSGWAKIEPLVRWLGVRIGPFMPASLEASLDKQILYAGDYLGLLPQEYIALCVLSGLMGAALGGAVELVSHVHGLAFLLFTIFGCVAPYFEISSCVQKRFVGINRSLPYAVDLFALGMSAGLDFPGAVRQYANKAMPDDPLADEVDYMLQMLQLGHTRRAALFDLSLRVPTDAVREFVQTVIHAEEKGHPLADALTIQAGVSRMRRTVRAEEEAAKAGVKLIIPLTLIFVSMLLLILAPIFLKVTDSLRNGNMETRNTTVVSSQERAT
jgi:tight adherence protein C